MQHRTVYNKITKQLAKKIKFRRIELAMSQQVLANESKIDRTYVSQLERGLANPSLSVLIALSIALEIPLISLLLKD